MKQIEIKPGFVLKLDDQDFDRYVGMKLYIVSKRYAAYFDYSGTKTKTVYIHRELMNPAPNQKIDHKDRDTLNCQRSNLRICTHSENMMNTVALRTGKVPYKGVSMLPNGNFRAAIYANGKQTHLGNFVCPKQAARAYDKAALEKNPEFCYLNNV